MKEIATTKIQNLPLKNIQQYVMKYKKTSFQIHNLAYRKIRQLLGTENRGICEQRSQGHPLGRREGGSDPCPRSQNSQWKGELGEQLGSILMKLKICIPYAQKFHSYIYTPGDMHRKGHGSAVLIKIYRQSKYPSSGE